MCKDWLIEKTTVEELEEKHKVWIFEICWWKPIPFGFCNQEWEDLKSELKSGDELWVFSSSTQLWENLMGCSGVCIVRNGEIIKSQITLMS